MSPSAFRQDPSPLQRHAPPVRLPRFLALAYVVLILYASLHPLAGWRESSAPLLEFLQAPWPRYFSAIDMAFNLLVYLPLGGLLVAAFHPLGRWSSLLLAVVLGSALSLGVEVAQHYLPSRVPSNVDLALNAAGTLSGALLGLNLRRSLFDGGLGHLLRERLLVPAPMADYGLVLLALWLLTQLSPEILLFGNGDLRHFFGLEPDYVEDLGAFVALEAVVAGCGVVVAGLLAGNLLRAWRVTGVIVFLASALLVKAVGAAILIAPDEFAHWLTPGNAAGMGIGLAVVGIASRLSRGGQQMTAGFALLLATALANLAPENPYLTAILQDWDQGHFLNFNGFSRLVAGLWPFLAMPYVLSARTWS